MKPKKKSPRGLRRRQGTWHYRFKVKGQEYSGPTGLPDTEAHVNEAIALRAQERQRIISGASSPQLQTKPFSDAAKEFLEWAEGEYSKHPQSYERIATSLASARLYFKREPLGNLGAGRLEGYKSFRRANYIQEITIRHDLHNLSLLFQYGQKQGWCAENPLRGKKQGGVVEIPSDKDAVRMYIFSEEDEAEYFAIAARISRDLYDIGRLMILQGCRPEELMRMEQTHIDLAAKTFHIPRGKSTAARRTLNMYPESALILARRLQKPGQWVFPSTRKKGKPIATLQKPHDKVREETEIPYVIYDFRHTIATRWVQAGIDLPTIAAWLGHGSLRSIMKYVHIQPSHMAEQQRKYQQRMEQVDKLSAIGPLADPKEPFRSTSEAEESQSAKQGKHTKNQQDRWRRGAESNRRIKVLQTDEVN